MNVVRAARMQSIDRTDTAYARGLRKWDASELLDESNLTQFVELVKSSRITDVHLCFAGDEFEKNPTALARLNRALHNAGARSWVLDSTKAYLATFFAGDDLIRYLVQLGDFNESQEEQSQFHGFQAYIEPAAGIPDDFKVLDPAKHMEHEMIVQMTVNLLTRASNLVRSYDMAFGLAIPSLFYGLHGQPALVSYGSSASGRGSVLDVLAPLMDECVLIGTENTDQDTLRGAAENAKNAFSKTLPDDSLFKVLRGVSNLDWSCLENKGPDNRPSTVLQVAEKLFSDDPAFDGTVLLGLF